MNIGVLGYGVVAQALIQELNSNEFNTSGFSVVKILRRKGKADEALMVEDFQEIINDEKIDVVIELLGGIHPAYEYLREALLKGKHVITANKVLVNEVGDELSQLAKKQKLAFLFSAACGGGIPILPMLLENKGLVIQAISGILNGTTNFILDEMESKGLEFSQALKQAQSLGYAEADPSNDVDGMDALYKIRLALAVAMNTWIDIDSILVEGIRTIKKEDIEEIQKLGFKIRLVASGKQVEKGFEMTVEPCLVSVNSVYAKTLQNHNLAVIHPMNGNPMVLSGKGAGGKPTASNVLRDLMSIQAGHIEMLPSGLTQQAADQSERKGKYLIRLDDDSVAFNDLAEKSWQVLDYQYLITKEVHSLDLFKRIKDYRQHKEVFFAKFEEDL